MVIGRNEFSLVKFEYKIVDCINYKSTFTILSVMDTLDNINVLFKNHFGPSDSEGLNLKLIFQIFFWVSNCVVVTKWRILTNGIIDKMNDERIDERHLYQTEIFEFIA